MQISRRGFLSFFRAVPVLPFISPVALLSAETAVPPNGMPVTALLNDAELARKAALWSTPSRAWMQHQLYLNNIAEEAMNQIQTAIQDKSYFGMDISSYIPKPEHSLGDYGEDIFWTNPDLNETPLSEIRIPRRIVRTSYGTVVQYEGETYQHALKLALWKRHASKVDWYF